MGLRTQGAKPSELCALRQPFWQAFQRLLEKAVILLRALGAEKAGLLRFHNEGGDIGQAMPVHAGPTPAILALRSLRSPAGPLQFERLARRVAFIAEVGGLDLVPNDLVQVAGGLALAAGVAKSNSLAGHRTDAAGANDERSHAGPRASGKHERGTPALADATG